jgi:AhpD family alkylhydroperoxidase
LHHRAIPSLKATPMAFDPAEWNEYRARMNERILSEDNLSLKRFFAVDHDVYEAGALDARTKELMGLAVSLALRCDDCVRYHVERSIAEGASARELTEAMTIALVVGGSITIPHLRRAFEAVDAFSG